MGWHRPGENHYLKQWWLDYRRMYASLSLIGLTVHIPGLNDPILIQMSNEMYSETCL